MSATALPSFVELMASLGLESNNEAPPSPSSSPSCSPRLSVTAASPTHTRSRSNPSLREVNLSHVKHARFSPYAPTVAPGRRGSVSSNSSNSDSEHPNRAPSRSPPRRIRRIASAHLTVNVIESPTESAYTPISSYVRRNTRPSPTSSLFSATSSQSNSTASSPLPFSIPSLPVLFPASPNSESNFPITPRDGDMDITPPVVQSDSPNLPLKGLPPVAEIPPTKHTPPRTGVRISSVSSSRSTNSVVDPSSRRGSVA